MQALIRPTRVRYLVLGLTTLGSILLYFDRFCISFCGRYIKEDLGLTNQQTSWVLGAFFFSYALAQVPGGFLTDRFGARTMLTLYIVLWSLFTGLTGLATSFLMLIVLRLGFGVAQAGAYPASVNLISKWAHFATRGFASSLIAFGGRIGGFLAPIVTGLVLVWYVPVDISSELTVGDILDYPRLCDQLAKLESPARKVVLAALKPEDLDMVLAQGAAYGNDPNLFFHKDIVSLVTALNAALANRDLVDSVSLEGIILPGEAKGLLRKPRADLTRAEVQRLNRLVLEELAPDSIRRIHGLGWRPAMMLFGVVGLLVAGMFWFWFRGRPAEHPYCNDAEVDFIEGSRPASAPNPHGKATRVPLGRLVSSGSMWLMCLSQFGTNVGWVFLVTLLPRYLDEVHRSPIEARSVLSSLPLLAGWAGLLGGGWFTDWFARRTSLRWSRALPIAFTRFFATGGYLLCMYYQELWFVMVMFCLIAFFCDFGIPAMWAFNLDIGGRYVGSVLGWGNMWGNFGGGVGPPLFDSVVGNGQWNHVFLVCAIAFFISGASALVIDASVPIANDEAPSEPRTK